MSSASHKLSLAVSAILYRFDYCVQVKVLKRNPPRCLLFICLQFVCQTIHSLVFGISRKSDLKISCEKFFSFSLMFFSFFTSLSRSLFDSFQLQPPADFPLLCWPTSITSLNSSDMLFFRGGFILADEAFLHLITKVSISSRQ